MKIKKITVGFVIQTWDAETGKFESQEFIAGDEFNYEDENGEMIDVDEENPLWGEDFLAKYPYRSFEMVQDSLYDPFFLGYEAAHTNQKRQPPHNLTEQEKTEWLAGYNEATLDAKLGR
jgi:hypothetical protein